MPTPSNSNSHDVDMRSEDTSGAPVSSKAAIKGQNESVLFTPYRSLGVVCNEVRPSYRVQPGARRFTSLVCAVDNVVLHYKAEKLRLIAISDPFPEAVSHVACNASGIFGVAGERIGVLPFCRDIARWIEIGARPKHVLLFGDQFVVVDENNGIRVINVETGELVLHLEGSGHFDITVVAHPPSYVNKIIVGSAAGKLRLYNTRTGKLVHEFASTFDAAITVIEPTPALDVMAIGLKNGRIVLHNVKTDEALMSFKHDHAVSAISFRLDNTETMVSADVQGLLAVWDLEKRELIGRISSVHKAAITSLYFMPSEPILVSTSLDNSIRSWVLDQADAMPRQLVILEGHSLPVETVMFSNAHDVLSAGLDGSVRKHSVVSTVTRQKLGNAVTAKSQKTKTKRSSLDAATIEPVVQFAIGWSREAQWDNVVCRHQGSVVTTTWTTRRQTQGLHKFVHERFLANDAYVEATATSITISPCGNFVFIGYSSGHIDQYNIQSGRFIKSFMKDAEKLTELERQNRPAHEAAVVGLAIDVKNELVSGGEDGKLQFWSASAGKLQSRMGVKGRIERMEACRANSLIATVWSTRENESTISVLDSLTRNVVRTFKHVGRSVLAVEFSPDGRLLLASDDDRCIRVWELSTFALIDVITCGEPCTGLSFNSSGEFLATCHRGEKAVLVWASKRHFVGRVPFRALPPDFIPKPGSKIADTLIDDLTVALQNTDIERDQIDSSLVTYSGLPASRWANLPDISLIKQRNKPAEPPKKPKRVPFFLESKATVDGFEFEKIDVDGLEKEERQIIQAKRNLLELESEYSSRLRRCESPEDYEACFSLLKQMSVSAVDFQIRTLSEEVLPQFFKVLLQQLNRRQNFDLVQAYMASALKIHRACLWKASDDDDDELSETLDELRAALEDVWTPLDDLMVKNASILQWTKNALV